MKKATKADCIRKAINISSQKDFFKFDKNTFNPELIKKNLQTRILLYFWFQVWGNYRKVYKLCFIIGLLVLEMESTYRQYNELQ